MFDRIAGALLGLIEAAAIVAFLLFTARALFGDG